MAGNLAKAGGCSCSCQLCCAQVTGKTEGDEAPDKLRHLKRPDEEAEMKVRDIRGKAHLQNIKDDHRKGDLQLVNHLLRDWIHESWGLYHRSHIGNSLRGGDQPSNRRCEQWHILYCLHSRACCNTTRRKTRKSTGNARFTFWSSVRRTIFLPFYIALFLAPVIRPPSGILLPREASRPQ